MRDAVAVSAMVRALRPLPEFSQRPARAAAYLAAGLDPSDIARLDRYALAAETERRRLFPSFAPSSSPAGELANPGAITP